MTRSRNLCSMMALALLAALFPACSGDDDAGGTSQDAVTATGTDAGLSDVAAAAGCADAQRTFAGSGPYIAGVTRLTVDGLPVEVWYPAERGTEAGLPKDAYDMRDWLPADVASRVGDDAAPIHETDAWRDLAVARGGPFPVVLFSHGLGGYRMQSTFLTTHLASWGFIVAAPEHPERNLAAVLGGGQLGDDGPAQLAAALEGLGAEQVGTGPLAGQIDLTRVAASGHSAGGGAVAAVAPNAPFSAWIMLASIAVPDAPGSAGLVMGGTRDGFAGAQQVLSVYEGVEGAAVRRLVSIEGAGHLAFSDICVIGADQGGVVKIAQDAGLEIPDLVVELANDGCRPSDLPVAEAWPVIRHAAVAHLRDAFGIGMGPSTLGADLGACHGALLADWREDVRGNVVAPSPDANGADPGPADTGAGSDPGIAADSGAPADTTSADAAPPADTAGGPDPSAGLVACGDTQCNVGSEVCCVGLGGPAGCKASCGFLEAPQGCDGPEDCGDGQLCCVGFPSGASCKAQCGQNDQELCHDNGDCAAPTTCQPCQFPGGPPTLVCTEGC